MKVVCIDVYKNGILTLGKAYEVLAIKISQPIDADLDRLSYLIIADNGLEVRVSKSRFISTEEYRETQLGKILN